MANQLGTLSSTLIVQRALALVFVKRPVLKRFSLKLTADPVKLGQTVTTRLRTIPPVQPFGSAPSDVTTTDVPVVVNQFMQVMVSFTAAQLASTDRDLVQEQAEPLAVSVATYLVDTAAGLFSDANYGATNKMVTTVANTSYATLVAARKGLVKLGVPEQGEKFALVNADLYEKFLNDPLCNRSSKVILNGNDPVSTGELTAAEGIAGFPSISEYPGLPTTNNMLAAYGTPDAVALASGVPRDPRTVLPNTSAPFSLGVIEDPGSGFAVMVQEFIGTDLSANVRLCWICGMAPGNTNNLIRQVSA